MTPVGCTRFSFSTLPSDSRMKIGQVPSASWSLTYVSAMRFAASRYFASFTRS